MYRHMYTYMYLYMHIHLYMCMCMYMHAGGPAGPPGVRHVLTHPNTLKR